ncbi:hypothetical protein [Natrialba asiatica]|uniref:Uncharacterized protein n=1 Tax=Natrialba asiatica (strain ATCC 700177 / DSM 12278 / JCM 9576 / FERM P-10747 / NBRC 102637 / 172P1) TaxID=29540 RepID=M0ASU4_NATA1|nr:hypothetical protein [Natrialba asiatica]ELZ01786.1 hypothetical protein C481_09707 [Natrialba asiatica DSM 12278]
MPHNGKRSSNQIGRRKVLKLASVTSLGGLGATASAAASQYEPQVIRIRGRYESPITSSEAREGLERLVEKSPSAHSKALDTQGTSEFREGFETVEYVARIGSNGRVSQYYGGSSEATEASAHAKGKKKKDEFQTSEVTTSSPPVESGPEWDFIDDWQANETAHWGELNHNIEWYYVLEDSEVRNAFRSLIASSDDTINPYSRWIDTTHDWGESELGSESIHNAGPTTTHDEGYTVSIGYPAGGSLSWNAGGSGDVEQTLDNSDPSIDWHYGIPRNGTSWFYPGSHVVADQGSYGDKVITDRAEAIWGSVYTLRHNWHMSNYYW